MATKTHLNRLAPIGITLVVLVFLFIVQAIQINAPEWGAAKGISNIKSMFFDWRVKMAQKYAQAPSTNLAAVFIDETTLQEFNAGFNEGNTGTVVRVSAWPFPRHIHGRLVRELQAQGAKGVAFDVMFSESRMDDAGVDMPRSDALQLGFKEGEFGTFWKSTEWTDSSKPGDVGKRVNVESDEFFAASIRKAQNVILATETHEGVRPADLFATNAISMGDIAVRKDQDGTLRRINVFSDVPIWNPIIEKVITQYGYYPNMYRLKSSQVIFTNIDKTNFVIQTKLDRTFNPNDLPAMILKGDTEAFPKAYEMVRVWNMGVVIAARILGLDLNRAEVDLAKGRIILPGTNGVTRILPVDHKGRMLVNWKTKWNDPRLLTLSYSTIVNMDCLRHGTNAAEVGMYVQQMREEGKTNLFGDQPFKDKIVIVGSTMVGSNLRDMGPTPLSGETFFVSCHWNVADSIIKDEFIQQMSNWGESALILIMGIIAAWLTYRLRILVASFLIISATIAFMAASAWLFVKYKFWMPVTMPIMGGLIFMHVSTMTHRVLMEQQEKKKVKSVFARLVSPNVVNELLGADTLSLGGARRAVTVFFSDVRGFTEMTDSYQVRAEDYVRENQISGKAAEAYFDDQAREVLSTVNLFLSTIADNIKKHNGTLDKYIGDCVMAFWGAPTPNDNHARDCVKAAIDAQRAMYMLNVDRARENQRREKENITRAANKQPLLAMLPLLSLGTGINTGVVIVGLMGSEAHILNYTVFGREVNLASRLEGISGRGRIIISEATLAGLQNSAPEIAATCVEQPPATLKGFRKAVKNYEVPWKTADMPALAALASAAPAAKPESHEPLQETPPTSAAVNPSQ